MFCTLTMSSHCAQALNDFDSVLSTAPWCMVYHHPCFVSSPPLYRGANQDSEGLSPVSKGTELVDRRPKIRTQTQTSSLALKFLFTLPIASSLLWPLKSFLLLPVSIKPRLFQGALQDLDHS